MKLLSKRVRVGSKLEPVLAAYDLGPVDEEILREAFETVRGVLVLTDGQCREPFMVKDIQVRRHGSDEFVEFPLYRTNMSSEELHANPAYARKYFPLLLKQIDREEARDADL